MVDTQHSYSKLFRVESRLVLPFSFHQPNVPPNWPQQHRHSLKMLGTQSLQARGDLQSRVTEPSGDQMKQADQAVFNEFDKLPNAANVRMPVVAALFCVSPATVWRWCRAGHLPSPNRIGGVTVWNVGLLRNSMQTRSGIESLAVSKVPVGGVRHTAPPEANEPTGPAKKFR